MKLAQVAWRNIFRNKRRSALSAGAIAIAAMSIVLLFGLIDWLKDDLKNNLIKFYTGQIRIRHVDFDKYEHLSPLHLKVDHIPQLIEELSHIKGIKAIAPRVSFPAMAVEKEGSLLGLYGRAVDFEIEKEFSSLEEYLVSGRLPEEGKRELIITPSLAEELQKKSGEKITLLARTASYGTNAMTFTVTGLINLPFSGMERTFFIPLDTGQRFLRMRSQGSTSYDAASELLILLDNNVKEKQVLSEVENLISSGKYGKLKALPWTEIPTLYSIISMAERIYSLIGFFFLLLGSTVIINTTMMVVYERIREIGTMSALGMKKSHLVQLFFLEALYLALVGSFVGVLFGGIISYPLSMYGIDFSRATRGMEWPVSSVYYITPSISTYITVFLFSVLVSAISSIFPAGKAAKMDPIRALRTI